MLSAPRGRLFGPTGALAFRPAADLAAIWSRACLVLATPLMSGAGTHLLLGPPLRRRGRDFCRAARLLTSVAPSSRAFGWLRLRTWSARRGRDFGRAFLGGLRVAPAADLVRARLRFLRGAAGEL